jgi:general secretion pathway protein D
MSPRLVLICLLFPLVVSLRAQQPQLTPQMNSPGGEEMVSYEASNAPITAVLAEYERLTGKTLIEDSNLMANAVPLTISLPQPVKKSQLIRLIEAALLLNNYALIPGPGENTMKVINLSTGKNARSEGVRLYTSPEDMPVGEEIVSYYMPLNHISANEALTVFNTHILPRAYTSFVPINSAQAVVITETTNVIRQLIALKELIDVPPAATSTVFVQLIRADAERVCDTLNKLMDNGGGQARGPVGPQGQNVPVSNPSAGTVITGLQAQLIPDTRTNRVLIVSRPQSLDMIRALVESFDQASIAAEPLEYKLRYISAGEALPVLSDLLNEEQQYGGGGTNPNQPQQQQQQQQQLNQNRNPNLGSFRSSSSTSGSSTLGGGYSPTSQSAGSVGAGQDLLQEPNEQLGPQSAIVGKTRIISDAKDNKIIVIGPPESIQKVRTLLDRLDRRPQQVYLSTVIGQLQLNNEFDFGVDFTQTYKKIYGNNGFASSNLSSTGTQAGIFDSNGRIIIDPRQILTTGAVPGTQGLAIYGSITDAIRVFVRAVDTRDKFTILARPAIYTANNKRAVISSGQRVPVPGTTLTNVNSVNNNTAAVQATIEYEDVELRLEVIPLINSNREVTLKIAQINDSLGNNVTISGNTVPTVNSQRLTTTVTVPSGATVVLGGLIQDNIKKSTSGIPYAMDVPYIGHLFKFQTHTRNRSELLVFIQPTVVESNVQTLRASLKEEKRTEVGNEMSNLAHPEDYASPAPDENTKRRRPAK